MNKKIQIALIVAGVFLILAGINTLLFGAPQRKAELEQFTVSLGSEASDSTELAALLKNKGFIKSEQGFKIAFFQSLTGLLGTTCVDCFSPGAYQISKSMTAWQIAAAIKKGPDMEWVVIPEGLRKEQIADIIGDALRWDETTKKKWVTDYTAMKYEEVEGVYFPDTYLIPWNEEPLKVADRLRTKFNMMLEPYYQESLKQNIKWDTLLKIASIVQREAAGKDDMPVIAGVLWNRLLSNPPMKLEIDATVQYARDNIIHYDNTNNNKLTLDYSSEGSWWTPIKAEDIKIESPYNTYLNKGLPPHPICNPGIEAISAVLNPAKTECLYYLHDADRQIHCAKTYEEHQANIEQYLR